MNIPLIAAFFLYAFSLFMISLYFYKNNTNASNFILGNHSVNYWVTAVATQASDMGSWLFLGFPAAIYINGLFEFWTAIGLISFTFLNWQFIAPRLRKRTETLKSLTIPSYLEDHFHDPSGSIRFVSSFVILIFFTFYIASGLVAMGRLFESAFAISYHSGIIVGLAIGLFYTLIGGFVAVAWCDFFQGIFLLIMIVLVPTYAFFTIGSISAIINTAHAKQVSISLLSSPRDILHALFLSCSWGLGYFGQPHLLINFMGIKNPKNIVYAKYVGISWQIIVLTASASAGLVALAFFPHDPINPELLFVSMAQALFHPFVVGLLICAILAATLSTMDSHILVSGSSIAEDLYKKLYNKHASSKKIVLLARIGSLILSTIALIIAWSGKSSIYNLVNYAWSGTGSSFGPVIIASLYSKKTTWQGALAGLISGCLVSAFLPYFSPKILPLIPGFTAGMLAMCIVSYITRVSAKSQHTPKSKI